MQNLAPAPAEIGLPDARFRCAPSDFVVDELPETVGGKVLKYKLRVAHADFYAS